MQRPHVYKDDPSKHSYCHASGDLPITAADAHLIAAAPEMLEALQHMAVTFQKQAMSVRIDEQRSLWQALEVQARAAIAKATGDTK
jgi:hypothetical protein